MALRTSLALALALALSCALGCKTSQTQQPQPQGPPKKFEITLRVRPKADLNPNDRGEPTPVQLRVYQLKDRPRFTEAAFEDLWVKDKEVLADSLLSGPKELSFEPGPSEEGAPLAYDIKLEPDTKFIGLMALFSAPRKEGLEERKLCVTIDEADIRVFELTGHKIVITKLTLDEE